MLYWLRAKVGHEKEQSDRVFKRAQGVGEPEARNGLADELEDPKLYIGFAKKV